jgi:hypothetical protein
LAAEDKPVSLTTHRGISSKAIDSMLAPEVLVQHLRDHLAHSRQSRPRRSWRRHRPTPGRHGCRQSRDRYAVCLGGCSPRHPTPTGPSADVHAFSSPANPSQSLLFRVGQLALESEACKSDAYAG